MELFNLLETGIPVFGQTFDVSLNWIGQLIRWLCNGVGVVGVGIILFSLVLKLITLPFDVFQRISMRKQNIQMKENKERMERLQKQYANDKDKYNQKVMEMYKENGMSVFSSCLPLILSMVIFIVAINAFNAYAQYSNIENYNTMVDAYNAEMMQYTPDLSEDKYDVMVVEDATGEKSVVYTVEDGTAGKFIYYKAVLDKEKNPSYATMTTGEKVAYILSAQKEYYVDVDRSLAEITGEDKVQLDADVAAAIASAEAAATANGGTFTAEQRAEATGEVVKDYLIGKAQDAVQVAYDEKVKGNTSFLWIKNIWATDASYKHPVLSATDFETEAKREEFNVGSKDVEYENIHQYTNAYKNDAYECVTGKLTVQKSQANGYFILIALSIGTILLQQFIMQRSQKEQQKFSSVDGSAGSQQKVTTIVMTVMFAVFSFMYSSAFSIYMITSNIFSMISTLVINALVDSKIKRKAKAVEAAKQGNPNLERIEKAKQAGIQAAKDSKKKNK